MAPKRGIKRKDKSRVVLKKGESQRKDGTYDYRWTSRNGRRHSIYAQTLEELRIKEDAITRDEMDGIRAEARCTTLNELFEVWAQVKRGLKDNTYQNYLYVYRQFVAPDFGQSRISSIKKTDIKRFYNMLADQRGLKISTIESVHTVLHQVLTTAVEDNYLRSNPSDNVLRELKKEKDFARSMGRLVEVRTYRPIDKQKEFCGVLDAYDENSVTINEDGVLRTFEKKDIALIRLAIEF